MRIPNTTQAGLVAVKKGSGALPRSACDIVLRFPPRIAKKLLEAGGVIVGSPLYVSRVEGNYQVHMVLTGEVGQTLELDLPIKGVDKGETERARRYGSGN
jgi:hypothetical protein